MSANIGNEMYGWMRDLFPLNRSITGHGTRQTLAYIKELLPEMQIHEVPSGTQAFDWTVPDEWNVKEAWIRHESGKVIADFKENNLHLMGYSEPFEGQLDLEELQEHLYSLPDQSSAIPYITSYYKRRWGFCITEQERKILKHGKYDVLVNSTLAPGHLTYGELLLPGKSHDEILLSTYVCHPSMANNELSGPVVTAALLRWLKQLDHHFTYRAVFIPETIGSLVYLSKHLDHLKKHIKAGFVITCVGDDNNYSLLKSRYGNTLADRAAEHLLRHKHSDFKTYSFLKRGSDERQYCSSGIDLPVCSLMRTKYGEYPEYHTSLDNLQFVSPKGLRGAYEAMHDVLTILEGNHTYRSSVLGEPQLGKRGLYPTLSTKESGKYSRTMLNTIAFADGQTSLLEIADHIGECCLDLIPIAEQLCKCGLFDKVNEERLVPCQ
jgi:aminopeptidase-like protein